MTLKHYAALLVLAALWGGSFMFLRVASPEFGPLPLIFVRTLLAALTLLPFFLHVQPMRSLLTYWREYFVVGAIGTAVPFALVTYSALHLTSGFMSVVNALVPISSGVIAYSMLREPFSRFKAMGLSFGFVGALVLSYPRLSGEDLLLMLPILAGLGSTVFYAYSSCYSKLKLAKMSPYAVTFGSQFYAALVAAPFAWLYWPTAMPSFNAWASVVVLAIVCTAFALVVFFRLIIEVGVTNTLVVTYLIPIFGILWGALFLGEQLSLSLLVGGVLILLGVGFATRR